MWSLFSRDPSKDFGYEIGEGNVELAQSFWTLHDGKKKGTLESVSIFRYEQRANDESFMDLAKNAVKRLKTLRHPSILTYIDSLETDKTIVMVTEHVVPLKTYLHKVSSQKPAQKELLISWGLLSTSKGVSFLNNDCNLLATNVSLSTVFVNDSGDWKLGNFDYLCPPNESFPYKVYHQHKNFLPPEINSSSGSLCKTIDSWYLGCLVWQLFNGQLSDASDLKKENKIPKKLVAYKSLVAENPRSRCSIQEFIEKNEAANGFFRNAFIETMLFLQEIQIKNQAEKNRFFLNLNTKLDSYPEDICRNKIHPLIVTSLDYGEVNPNVLEILFKVGKMFDEKEYQRRMVPCIIKLFACKDRSIRSKLLKEMEFYIELIPSNSINDQIFPNVLQGFIDSNPVIRELTVKSVYQLSSKLSSHNLNEEVIKHFSRLEFKDPEGGIRTNTIVCLGKITGRLSPHTRQSIVLPSFLRSLRDPFPPARIAAILSLCATQNFFTLQDVSSKIIPNLSILLMDPEKEVRNHVFTSINNFLKKMENYSNDPTLIEKLESDVNCADSNASSKLTSGLSWAVSSLAAKLVARTKWEDDETTSSSSSSSQSRVGNITKPIKTEEKVAEIVEDKDSTDQGSDVSSRAEVPNENGWNDNWDEDFFAENTKNAIDVEKDEEKAKESKPANAWDMDDDWDNFSPAKPTVQARPAAVAERKIANKPATTKNTANKRGPMKLGAQKLTKSNLD